MICLTLTKSLSETGEFPPFGLGDGTDAEFACPARLRPGIDTDHDKVRLLRNAVSDLRPQSLGASLGLGTRHRLERAGEHQRLAGDLALGRLRSPAPLFGNAPGHRAAHDPVTTG